MCLNNNIQELVSSLGSSLVDQKQLELLGLIYLIKQEETAENREVFYLPK